MNWRRTAVCLTVAFVVGVVLGFTLTQLAFLVRSSP